MNVPRVTLKASSSVYFEYLTVTRLAPTQEENLSSCPVVSGHLNTQIKVSESAPFDNLAFAIE